MLYLLGSEAYSETQVLKLQTKFSDFSPELQLIACRYFYLLDGPHKLDAAASATVMELLNVAESINMLPANSLLVVPRFGTVSPWCAKTMDIISQCNLKNIQRIERGIIYYFNHLPRNLPLDVLHDRMTESIVFSLQDAAALFTTHEPPPLETIDVLKEGKKALVTANAQQGWALSEIEIEYLINYFLKQKRNPTDVELMMFAQANSEHCRHKIFNAEWVVDDKRDKRSLFNMIKYTYQQHPTQVLSAYHDNSAVIQGRMSKWFYPDMVAKQYTYQEQMTDIMIKVETHNHPTGIAPWPGAATGAGGEIRDEGATGCGAKPKAGLVGFTVSHLNIPGFEQPWEFAIQKPENMCSALEIMLQAPIGAASFNNEFGRPNLCGYFRTLTQPVNANDDTIWYGYHKPIMIAGGFGNIQRQHINKRSLSAGVKIAVLGGPSLPIGLGGGAASSVSSGENSKELDFASVQRSNPQMQRRCQEVIDHCCMLGPTNPILSIHDVGAGGLANAIPELVAASHCGATVELRDIPSADPSMTPLVIWCNEAQERYVLALEPSLLDNFIAIAAREQCSFAIVGEVTEEQQFIVNDRLFENKPVDLEMRLLFGDTPKQFFHVQNHGFPANAFDHNKIDLQEAIQRVLQLPCVADKSFLITIGDRSVGGLCARDQMVGPWQVPVADVAVTTTDFHNVMGEAMAMGERHPLAMIDPKHAARMAVGEAICNLAAADIGTINNIVLSANWMATSDIEQQQYALHEAVKTVAMDLCPALGIAIPVGKDSLSMQTHWQDKRGDKTVYSPLSLVISAFSRVNDVRKTLTPELKRDKNSVLLLIELANGQQRLGGSTLAQVFQARGVDAPNLDEPERLKQFINALDQLKQQALISAYHDRSDGGLLITLFEMGFASHLGLTIELDKLGEDSLAALFNEELGAVIQVGSEQLTTVHAILEEYGLLKNTHQVATINNRDVIEIKHKGQELFAEKRIVLQQLWSKTSFKLQSLRDNPECAEEAFSAIADKDDPGLHAVLSFDASESIIVPYAKRDIPPQVAILREQGVNGQVEMAAAFTKAGFAAIDVNMQDLIHGEVNLNQFRGLVACGGFSYGDVLGAGRGWAQSILQHEKLREQFARFFERSTTFSLGVCNGCQMLSHLRELIPGTEHWPYFLKNKSEQFEARLLMVGLTESPSLFTQGMSNSRLPIVVSHGEGQATWHDPEQQKIALANNTLVMHYVDNYAEVTERYPANPNGSVDGVTGFCSLDGRVTIMMPHPERLFRTLQFSWAPPEWGETSPWLRLFQNARRWVD